MIDKKLYKKPDSPYIDPILIFYRFLVEHLEDKKFARAKKKY